MDISYSHLLSALQILLLHSNGVSRASIKRVKMLASQLYSQAPSNISTLMADKMDKISSDRSRPVTGLSNGFSITLEPIQELHIVLDKALSIVKKSLLLNIQVKVSPPYTRELF